jgi:hypothetical protein
MNKKEVGRSVEDMTTRDMLNNLRGAMVHRINLLQELVDGIDSGERPATKDHMRALRQVVIDHIDELHDEAVFCLQRGHTDDFQRNLNEQKEYADRFIA